MKRMDLTGHAIDCVVFLALRQQSILAKRVVLHGRHMDGGQVAGSQRTAGLIASRRGLDAPLGFRGMTDGESVVDHLPVLFIEPQDPASSIMLDAPRFPL
jgi:hypothetical protein